MAGYPGMKHRKSPPDCHPERKHHAGGLCNSCYNRRLRLAKPESYQRWYEANRERICRQIKEYKYRVRYGVTFEFLNNLRAAQGNKCAICFDTLKNGKVDTDHCHLTGKIRGILCPMCNRGLGMFKDNPELLMSAYKYLLESHP